MLLIEKLPGKRRALKADSLEFICLFYCVTLGGCLNSLCFGFPEGFSLGFALMLSPLCQVLHTDDLIKLCSWNYYFPHFTGGGDF